MFQKATRKQAKARVAIDGPAGSGKTYTALIAAKSLANGGKIAVIDTERGSASLYADEFEFDVLELNNFNPRNYIQAIHEAEQAGYAVVVIDSMSHAWEGEGGVLDMHDAAIKRQKTENSFTAWKDVTPVHREFVDTMLQSPIHIIATMRAKMEYVQEGGKVRKIGLAPVQRAGTEYEFTLVCDMDVEHTLIVSKSRCKPLADKVVKLPGVAFFDTFRDWLNNGDAPAPQPVKVEQPKQEVKQEVKIPQTNGVVWSVSQKQALIDERLADNDFAAKGMLGLSNLPQDATQAEIVAWGKLYRDRRSDTNPATEKPYTAQQAAEFANAAVKAVA